MADLTMPETVRLGVCPFCGCPGPGVFGCRVICITCGAEAEAQAHSVDQALAALRADTPRGEPDAE